MPQAGRCIFGFQRLPQVEGREAESVIRAAVSSNQEQPRLSPRAVPPEAYHAPAIVPLPRYLDFEHS